MNEVQIKSLLAAAKKVLLVFPETVPDGIDTLSFNIPGYIIEDLREAVNTIEKHRKEKRL